MNRTEKKKKKCSVFTLECLMALVLVDSLLDISENRILLRVLLQKGRIFYINLWGGVCYLQNIFFFKLTFGYYFLTNSQI